ncbi:unnamed protein product [Rangifer tarandus platyrhynchus]|uniref:Uncharacterized protein n=2 Tax=Rangifer tarandus platyrhynchus TaxID=3082113 RepID=A0ACB0EPT8_RANTA|nr:unnamed protein product [Rangifer tarandus platyrhynchus]CAI9702720.1 unnamed protein product [Rangifer tarandus platyrhynchus]
MEGASGPVRSSFSALSPPALDAHPLAAWPLRSLGFPPLWPFPSTSRWAREGKRGGRDAGGESRLRGLFKPISVQINSTLRHPGVKGSVLRLGGWRAVEGGGITLISPRLNADAGDGSWLSARTLRRKAKVQPSAGTRGRGSHRDKFPGRLLGGWHLPPGAGLCRHPRSLQCRRELETARADGLVPAQLGRQRPKRDLFAAPDPNPQPSHPYTGDPEGLARAREKQRSLIRWRRYHSWLSTGPSQRPSQSSAFASIPKNNREAKNPLQPPAVFPISPTGLSQSPTPPRCSGAGQRDVDSQGWRLGSTFAVFDFLLEIPRGSPHGAAPASYARFSTWLGAYEDFKKPGPRHVPKRALIRGRHEDLDSFCKQASAACHVSSSPN